jgi:hypothetical protein
MAHSFRGSFAFSFFSLWAASAIAAAAKPAAPAADAFINARLEYSESAIGSLPFAIQFDDDISWDILEWPVDKPLI